MKPTRTEQRVELELPDGRGLVLTVSPSGKDLWYEVWHSCGKCVEKEGTVNLR